MYSFVLCKGTLEDTEDVHRLVREAADWLRRSKDTDQWAEPWPNRAGHRDRIRTDLNKGKTWLLRDGVTVAGTITIDTEEPVDADERPVWPAHKSPEPAIYVRRLIVGRRYSGIGLGAAMLDWAAEAATEEYQATLLRIDVWTTNRGLHEYYEGQLFARREARDPGELPDYPAQALFERLAVAPESVPKTDYRNFFRVEPGEHSHCRLMCL
jgi:GNAT superfamily N-acetyltransferase